MSTIERSRYARPRRLFAGCALSIIVLSSAFADDTEIFFGRGGDAFTNNPNILFVLDNSGSMEFTDAGTEGTRMARLQGAMRLLLDQSSSFNVGMAAFQGSYGGSAIRYPIGYLEGDSSALCENDLCPDETIVVRPASVGDDAVQDDDTNVITLQQSRLVMADAGTLQAEVTDGSQVSRSVFASGDAFEAMRKDDATRFDAGQDRPSHRLFHHDDDHEAQRLAFRFDDVLIPPDATVTQATIRFTRRALADQKGAVSARISAEATAAPDVYDIDPYVPLLSRSDTQNRTNALVSWDAIEPNDDSADSVRADPHVRTPDLSDILTEVVGLNGWNEGNAVSFLVSPANDYTPSTQDLRDFHGVQASDDLRPLLEYTFTRAENPDTGSLSSVASAHLDEYLEDNTGAAWRNTAASVTRLFHVGTGYTPRRLALRFEDLPIPKGATIRTARLTLHAAASDATDADPADWTRDPGAAQVASGPDKSEPSPMAGSPTEPDLGGASEDGVSLTITAERDDQPAPYDGAPISARTFTAQLRSWDALDERSNAAMESPDLANVISEVINLDDWNSGDDVSLLLSPSSNYGDVPDNVRRFLTTRGAIKPRLDVTWDAIDSGGPEIAGTQTTAIRFPRVFVPPGATIKSARLVFTAAATDDEPTDLTISAEADGAPLPLDSDINDIGARTRTDARETWAPGSWDRIGNEYATPDLARIVDEVVKLSNWCSGNPMTLFVRGTGKRQAVAFEEASSAASRLEIVYEPSSIAGDSYCSNTSVDVSMPDGTDDATVDLSSGAQDASGVALSTNARADGSGAARAIGLRFRDIQVPQGARIVSAALRLTTRTAITDSATLDVRGENSDDARPFRATDPPLASREWSSASVSWTSDGPVAIGDAVSSEDITSLVSDVVNRPGWASGNAIGLRLSAASGGVRSFVSRDSDQATAPRLVIFYESQRSEAGTHFRENLKREVDLLGTSGNTPIVSSLLEAANYYRGRPVDYGTRRGPQDFQEAPWFRLSHPYSYTGGTVHRPDGCSPSDPDTTGCIREEILGNPVYESPITSECQSHHIVLLSDGEATVDTLVQDRISALTGGCDRSHPNQSEHCGREFGRWLSTTDHQPSIDGNQTINVHAIGLAFGQDEVSRKASAFLEDIAREGGGGFYEATSAEQLLNAFQNIFINVSKTDTSFVAPTVTVSSQNRLKNRDDLYFSLFTPEPTARWGGNLKRYRSSADSGGTADIVDVDGTTAIDPATGKFYPGARSFWSSVTDGGSVLLGGAAEKLERSGTSNETRRVATFTGMVDGGSRQLMRSVNRLDHANSRIERDHYDLPPGYSGRAGYFEQLVDWARGRDVLDVDADGNTDETRPEMGDPMHTQPVMLNYADGRSIVFVATNEGYLHAIDSATGIEQWAFIPQELLKNLHDFFQNAATRQRPYGLDGGITTWVDDTDKDGVIDPGEKAYLYLGMRRGGNAYYALDVSSLADPRFLWKIDGGSKVVPDGDDTTADGDFEELGQSWSTPVKTRIIDGDGDDVVDALVFAGGYDTNQDPPLAGTDPNAPPVSTRSTDGVGRTLYIVNARSGKLLWRTSTADPAYSAMQYSIPSDVKVIDVDFDGVADMMFVGDTGGQLWRFDFNNDRSVTRSLAQRLSGGRIGLFAGDGVGEDRRFYEPPSVSLVNVGGTQQLAISIGSGWRAHPLNTATQDRIYSVRSTHVYGPPLDTFGAITYPLVTDDSDGAATTGFADVTHRLTPAPDEVQKGWWIDIGVAVDGGAAAPGEKILSAALVADNQLLFTSYRPETDITACSPAVGSSAVWAINVLNGAPTGAFGNDDSSSVLTDRQSVLNQSGLAPPISVLFPEAGEATVMVGTEKLDTIDIGALRRRTFWQEMLE